MSIATLVQKSFEESVDASQLLLQNIQSFTGKQAGTHILDIITNKHNSAKIPGY